MDNSTQVSSASMRRRLGATVILVVALAAAFLAGLMFRGTRSAAEPPKETRTSASTKVVEPDMVTLDREIQRSVGLQTAPVTLRTLQQTIQATGSVGPNETRLGHIRAIARGQIHTVHVRLGDRVQAGQPLLAYDNIELGDAIGQYLSALATLEKAKSEADVAKRSADRARNLVTLGAVAQAEYDRREAEHRNALATVESQRADAARTEEKLHRFGMTDPEIGEFKPRADSQYHRESSHSTLVAPFSGIVTHYSVSPGESIGPDNELMIVADLSTVWVQADVYEKDIAMVRQGTAATVSVEAHPGRTFAGRITYVSDFLDPKTRTVKVRCEVPNREGLLKLDMFATIRIPVPTRRDAVLIPAAAVQQIDGQPVAFIKTGEMQFQKRLLKLGERSNGWIEVADGIRPGEQVVTEGSFILKSEAKKAELGHHQE
jgi:cobalt-zinc-cadmium efflux system membrane fusion protein